MSQSSFPGSTDSLGAALVPNEHHVAENRFHVEEDPRDARIRELEQIIKEMQEKYNYMRSGYEIERKSANDEATKNAVLQVKNQDAEARCAARDARIEELEQQLIAVKNEAAGAMRAVRNLRAMATSMAERLRHDADATMRFLNHD